jgi:hypothetical protein
MFHLQKQDKYRELTFDILEKRELNLERTGGYKSLYKYAAKLCNNKCTFLVKADPSLDYEDLVLEMLQVGIRAFYIAYQEKLYGYRQSINYAKKSLTNGCKQIINSRTAKKKSRYVQNTGESEGYMHSTISLDKKYRDDESSFSLYNLLPASNLTENEAQQSEVFRKLCSNFSDTELEFLRAFVEGPQFHKSKQNVNNYTKYFNSIAKRFKLNPATLRKKIISLLYPADVGQMVG